MTKTHSQYEELEPEYLDVVAGGASKVISRESTIGIPFVRPSSHHWETQSDQFPFGTTREQANDMVNRFNAPTDAALHGHGNDPKAEHDVVVGPFGIPAGRIDVDHHTDNDGNAEVVNSTAFPHVFHGTTTRSLVHTPEVYHAESVYTPEGYHVKTVGDGEGHIPVFDDIRHGINSAAGPEAFGDLDAAMMKEAMRAQAARDGGEQTAPHDVSPDQDGEPHGNDAPDNTFHATPHDVSPDQGGEPHGNDAPDGSAHATPHDVGPDQGSEPHGSDAPDGSVQATPHDAGPSDQGSESHGNDARDSTFQATPHDAGPSDQGSESHGNDASDSSASPGVSSGDSPGVGSSDSSGDGSF